MSSQARYLVSTQPRPSLTDKDIEDGTFDPFDRSTLSVLDLHAWGKWRVAMNKTLITRILLDWQPEAFSSNLIQVPISDAKQGKLMRVMMISSEPRSTDPFPSRSTAIDTYNRGDLNTEQFIYFGIPRAKWSNGGPTGREDDV